MRATYDATYNSEIEGKNVMASTVFHNAQVGYYIEEYKMDVKFGIQNLFDKMPPYLENGVTGTDDNLYSFRGRFFYGDVSVSF